MQKNEKYFLAKKMKNTGHVRSARLTCTCNASNTSRAHLLGADRYSYMAASSSTPTWFAHITNWRQTILFDCTTERKLNLSQQTIQYLSSICFVFTGERYWWLYAAAAASSGVVPEVSAASVEPAGTS
jgi:hypothetical protein